MQMPGMTQAHDLARHVRKIPMEEHLVPEKGPMLGEANVGVFIFQRHKDLTIFREGIVIPHRDQKTPPHGRLHKLFKPDPRGLEGFAQGTSPRPPKIKDITVEHTEVEVLPPPVEPNRFAKMTLAAGQQM